VFDYHLRGDQTLSAIGRLGFLAFAVVFAPEKSVVEAVHTQLSKWWKGGFEDCIPPRDLRPLQLPKGQNPRSKKVAIFALDAPAVLIESNLNDGYASLIHMVSAKLDQFEFVKVRSKPVGTDEWPIEEFDLMKGGRNGHVRHVWAALDTGGWKYGDTGDLQPFEEPEYYGKRAIKDRLTRSQIVRYLGRLGVDLEAVARNENCRLISYFSEVPRA
jgi:hypothetical protein